MKYSMALVTSATLASRDPGLADSRQRSPGRSCSAVVDLRLVQVGDPERLDQLKPQVGDLGGRNPARLLERRDRRRHLTVERREAGP